MRTRVTGTCIMFGLMFFFEYYSYSCPLSSSQIAQIISSQQKVACTVLHYKAEPEEMNVGNGTINGNVSIVQLPGIS